jgi:hypothetical protein
MILVCAALLVFSGHLNSLCDDRKRNPFRILMRNPSGRHGQR